MEKLCSLFLVLCLIFSLSACRKDNSVQDADTGSSSTLNQTEVTDISSTEQNTDTPTSTTDNNGGSSNTNVSSSTTSKPTTTKPETSKPETTKPSTPSHTHSYSGATCTAPAKCSCGETNGSALGHTWQNATCKAPKTCSVCKATEGTKADHIVSGDTCKWCKQVVVVNPNSFNANITYSCISKRYTGDVFGCPSDFDCYVFTLLDFDGESHSEAVYDSAQCEYGKDGHRHVHHNGNYYDNIAQSAGLYGETTYTIIDSEIIATVPVLSETQGKKATIHFQLLSNGTLKVSSLSGAVIPEITGITVGAIFYPNPNYEISYN